MQTDALLTQDELDFIQDIQHSPQFDVADATASLLLSSDSQLKSLLTRLIAHEQVTLQAQFENHQMSFPLQLVEDEFHATHLQVGAPSIYEDGPMVRPWRLTLDTPVALEDDMGLSTDLWVREISFKGVLLEVRQPEPPARFSLWFNPGSAEAPIALEGTLQRRAADGLAAYRLSQRHPAETERLREYILQQHRRAHPDVHAA